MERKDIQKVKINTDFMITSEFGTLRRGQEFDRDEDPDVFGELTLSMSNVGEDEDSRILVTEKVKPEEPSKKESAKKKGSKKKKSKAKKSDKDSDTKDDGDAGKAEEGSKDKE